MMLNEFSVDSTAFIISAAVLLPMVSVVVGCAFCRRLCKGNDEEEDGERRPLLTATDSTRVQSPRTERVENEQSPEPHREEQATPTQTGNRVNVSFVVHADVAADENKTEEKQQSHPTEANLIPDLTEPDEHEIVAENFEKIHSQYRPQEPPVIFEPRRPVTDDPLTTNVEDPVGESPNSKETPLEQVSEETDNLHETSSTNVTAELLPENNKTVDEEEVEKESKEKIEIHDPPSASASEEKVDTVPEPTSEEKEEIHEPSVSVNTEGADGIPDIVPAADGTGQTSEETGRVAESSVKSEASTVESEEKTKSEETSSILDEQVEIDFDTKPSLVRTILTKAAKKDSKAIFGLTVLDEELFVISQHSSDIEVYDSQSLDFKHQFHVESLYDPVDITSCRAHKCLYIFDWKGSSNEILKVDSGGKVILKWSTGQNGGFLSTAPDANVILSVWDKNILVEYSPNGQEIREIKLPPTIVELRLGMKLVNGNILVSHGEDEESEHRVCVLDENLAEIRSIGGVKGFSKEQFDSPNYLALERSSGFVLVADQNNKRVILLSSELEFKREVIEEADGLRYPVRLDLDQSSGKLYVADNDYLLTDKVWRDGRIRMFEFNVRQRTQQS